MQFKENQYKTKILTIFLQISTRAGNKLVKYSLEGGIVNLPMSTTRGRSWQQYLTTTSLNPLQFFCIL